MNPNKILGVSPNASVQEVQAAFRKAAFENHPDHSQSPEAVEAFIRIKEARDALMEQARDQPRTAPHDASSASQAAQRAAAATATAAYQAADDSLYDGMTPEEVAYIQKLDELASRRIKRTLFGKVNEPVEVTKHRNRIHTVNRRIDGKY